MSDWGPVFVAVVLFVLLTPGLLIQIPGRSRIVEFGNFQTSGVSILLSAFTFMWANKHMDFLVYTLNFRAVSRSCVD
ncbi:UNVERIFIED_CONTAM: hypothetical protein Sangu_0247500 [Sesamum angustifolium]|uniref:Uncharacterized protein n=1 Tax=Sesamum angustifolium TaxID=2727405 RepID=A0AAW2RPF9_9LAMI